MTMKLQGLLPLWFMHSVIIISRGTDGTMYRIFRVVVGFVSLPLNPFILKLLNNIDKKKEKKKNLSYGQWALRLTERCRPEGWSARTQLPEASTSMELNALWITTHHSTSGRTFTGELNPAPCPVQQLQLWSDCLTRLLSLLRIGRTARAGKAGLAFTFLLGVQVKHLNKLIIRRWQLSWQRLCTAELVSLPTQEKNFLQMVQEAGSPGIHKQIVKPENLKSMEARYEQTLKELANVIKVPSQIHLECPLFDRLFLSQECLFNHTRNGQSWFYCYNPVNQSLLCHEICLIFLQEQLWQLWNM